MYVMEDDRLSVTECVVTSGWAPGARVGHTCHYEPTHGCAVLFGGLHPGLGHLSDVSLGTLAQPTAAAASMQVAWSDLQCRNVHRRCYHGAAILETRSQLVVFGGEAPPNKRLNDTWLISLTDGAALTLITSEGAPPTPRHHHTCTAVRDPDGYRVLTLGGSPGEKVCGSEDCLHVLHLNDDGTSRWASGERVIESMAAAVLAASLSSHPGTTEAAARAADTEAARAAEALREQWALLDRHSHSACCIEDRHQLLVFGGCNAAGNASNALISVDAATYNCRRVSASGAAPSARYAHAACVVPDGGLPTLVVHGGRDRSRILSDVHVLDLRRLAWSRPVLEGLPRLVTRHSHALCLLRGGVDARTGSSAEPVLMIFGGYGERAYHSNSAVLLQRTMAPASPLSLRLETGSSPRGSSRAVSPRGRGSPRGLFASGAGSPERPVARAHDQAGLAAAAEGVSGMEAAGTAAGAAGSPFAIRTRIGSPGALGRDESPRRGGAAAEAARRGRLSATARIVAARTIIDQILALSSGFEVAADAAEPTASRERSGAAAGAGRGGMAGVAARSAATGAATAGAAAWEEAEAEAEAAAEEEEEEEEEADDDGGDDIESLAASGDEAARRAFEARAAEEVGYQMSEVGVSITWLEEEDARLREELSQLEAHRDAEHATRMRLDDEGLAAEGHLRTLQADVEARSKGMAAARNTLASAHVVNSQQIHQVCWQLLRGDTMMRAPMRPPSPPPPPAPPQGES